MYKTKTIVVLFILFSATRITAQIDKQSDLFKTLKAKDSLLFQDGFNQCNLNQIEKLVVDDIEFYHDKDGITQSKQKFINSIRKNICASDKNSIKRVLEETSLDVFPLYQEGKLYGALQKGIHHFGETKANFSHLWLKENTEWKLSRVISYNHHQEKNIQKIEFIQLPLKVMKIYPGVYEFSPEFILTVQIKDNVLYGGSQGQEVAIHCYDEHKFIDDEQTHNLKFIVNKKGIVTGLHMTGSGMEMTASKK